MNQLKNILKNKSIVVIILKITIKLIKIYKLNKNINKNYLHLITNESLFEFYIWK